MTSLRDSRKEQGQNRLAHKLMCTLIAGNILRMLLCFCEIALVEESIETFDQKRLTDPELLATTAAWAIFGAARRWYQVPDRVPAEDMAARTEAMVKPVFLSAM